MFTSKKLLEITGISRATMNNYVALGLLPRPDVKRPEGVGERARQLGYFPDDAVDRVAEVRRLKKDGLTMDQIVARLVSGGGGSDTGEEPAALAPAPAATTLSTAKPASVPAPDGSVRLTLDQLDQPAFMVNYNFLVEWCNPAAARELFGISGQLESAIGTRNLFKLLLNSPVVRPWVDRAALLAFQLSIAKIRLPKKSLAMLGGEVSAGDLGSLEALYDDTEPARPGMLCEAAHLNLAASGDAPRWCTVFASFFREGILFVHQPAETPSETFLELLSRRDQLIRAVVKSRQPILTPVCALVTDVQDSVKICAELPPEEYFELINQVWQVCETVLRKHHATQGKHAGDGMVCYFFPQPDCNYLLNALHVADELKRAMATLSKQWQVRKQWVNEIYLNIGLNEGEEWFGSYQTTTNIEFTVLGDTINHAGRLSDFARRGAIWATKNLIGKLTPEERQSIRFGIRRTNAEGREMWIPTTYSQPSNLIDLSNGKYEKFRDIATLAIAEVTEIAREEG